MAKVSRSDLGADNQECIKSLEDKTLDSEKRSEVILLRRHSRFGTIAAFDQVSAAWSEVSQPISSASEDIVGLYEFLSGKFCAIFRLNHDLFIRIGDRQLKLSKSVNISASGHNTKRVLSIYGPEIAMITLEYIATEPRDDDDLTPFIEPEDLDFGLFLSIIANNPSRQSVLKGLDHAN